MSDEQMTMALPIEKNNDVPAGWCVCGHSPMIHGTDETGACHLKDCNCKRFQRVK